MGTQLDDELDDVLALRTQQAMTNVHKCVPICNKKMRTVTYFDARRTVGYIDVVLNMYYALAVMIIHLQNIDYAVKI